MKSPVKRITQFTAATIINASVAIFMSVAISGTLGSIIAIIYFVAMMYLIDFCITEK